MFLIAGLILFSGLATANPGQAQETPPGSENSLVATTYPQPDGAGKYIVKRINLKLGSTTVTDNGQVRNLTQVPLVDKGTTLVPLRFISEAFGATVIWEKEANRIKIYYKGATLELGVGQPEALVNGGITPLSVPPRLVNGVTLVPLRFISEGLTARVTFNPLTKVIEIVSLNRAPVAVFRIKQNSVLIGEQIDYFEFSYDLDGDKIIDRVWTNRQDSFERPGTYQIELKVKDSNGIWSQPMVNSIEVKEIPNASPVAVPNAERTSVAMGETVIYQDNSFDPDGDLITERVWEGNKRAYFRPGSYPATLKVRDARGRWSEPVQVIITVTDVVLKDELTYNLENPLPGIRISTLPFNLSDFPELSFSSVDHGPTLLISNSPEKVDREGILYAGDITGEARLFLYHQNNGSSPLRFVIVAENRGSQSANLQIRRSGTGGPSSDVHQVSKAGMLRFWASTTNSQTTLLPGQRVVLTAPGASLVPAGQTLHALYDISTDAYIRLHFVAVNQNRDAAAVLPELQPLNRDQHIRGNFASSVREFAVNLNGARQKWIIADGKKDYFVGGIDNLTGAETVNKGNYGITYRMVVSSPQRVGILAINNSGGFAGAVSSGKDGVFGLPADGVAAYGQGVLMGVVQPGEQVTFDLIIPAASYLPLYFAAVPF